jgi:histidine triad (HIT) family protein
MDCVFCCIRDRSVPAEIVLDEPEVLAFLDSRPVFPGHVLVIPRVHHATLPELPAALIEPLFEAVQRVSEAVPPAMGGDGTFVAVNNVVSQSAPHLHVHVVPRKRKDGLRGFMWPRHPYAGREAMAEAGAAIRASLEGFANRATPRT